MRSAGSRHLIITLLGGACLTVTACLPAAAPPPAAAPLVQPPPAAPSVSAPACGAQISASSFGTSSFGGAGDAPGLASQGWDRTDEATPADDAGINSSEARAQATDAARQAIADPAIPGTAGNVPIVVTTVDADGHPDIKTLTATSVKNASNQAAQVTNDVNDDGGQVLAVEPDHTMSTTGTATDPARSQQWPLTQLDYENVWNTSTGGGACVAVLDTGIDVNHPEFAGRIAGTYDLTGQGVQDGYGHGTHVAGIIAADANNGIGIAGAAPGASLLAVKVLANNGVGNSSWTANGMIWAVDHGAKIINMSLGAACASSTPAGCDTQAMRVAMLYAQNHDVMVIAAAGNDGDPNSPANNPKWNYWSWPGAYDWSIAVAATTSSSQHATFSTQASYVDVSAPGSNVLSTMAPNSATGQAYGNASYLMMSGTSMATPYVTAEAALLRASHPNETATQIRNRIVGNVTPLGPASTFGSGLINPGAANA